MQKTTLYKSHLIANATMLDFGGWLLPLHYGSQIKEHNAVRNDVGMFDVSHMCIIDIQGANSYNFLRKLLANDIAKIISGKALYSCMLNETAGILDDLIVYCINDCSYRLVVNAKTAQGDIAWLTSFANDLNIKVKNDLAIIAVQGPNARIKLGNAIRDIKILCENLKPFEFKISNSFFIACTGYTGEDGIEIIIPQRLAPTIWNKCIKNGITPCGLGARDTLRIEAGMSLYGNELSTKVTPYQCGLDWTVDNKDSHRNFIGKQFLKKTEITIKGIVLDGKVMVRAGQFVDTDKGQAVVTSGTFSPTMKAPIAMVRINKQATQCSVNVRGKELTAKIVDLPLVRHGKILI